MHPYTWYVVDHALTAPHEDYESNDGANDEFQNNLWFINNDDQFITTILLFIICIHEM